MSFTFEELGSVFIELVANQSSFYLFTDEIRISDERKIVFLKHDVECNCRKALETALIENELGIRATYYIQDYLLENKDNVAILRRIEGMGHEIGFHYDSLDRMGGDRQAAIEDFKNSIRRFTEAGFSVRTICPHGNAALQRDGWLSNKELAPLINRAWPELVDVVTWVCRENRRTIYISDAGYGLIEVSDFNSQSKESSRGVKVGRLLENPKGSVMVLSLHPHRFERYKVIRAMRRRTFWAIKLLYGLVLRIRGARHVASAAYRIGKFL